MDSPSSSISALTVSLPYDTGVVPFGTFPTSSLFPYHLESNSARLSNDSESEISPSPLQSKESSSESKSTSVSVRGFIVHLFSSRSHSENQYSYPSTIPSRSVSGSLGSVTPNIACNIGFAGIPDFHSRYCSIPRSALPSLLNKILKTLFSKAMLSISRASSPKFGTPSG